MSKVLVRHPGVVIATLACVAMGYNASRVFSKALAISPTPMGPKGELAVHGHAEPAIDTLDVWEAVDLDPFRKDRTAAEVRYRLPRAKADSAEKVADEPAAVTLLGTVMQTDGSGIALCQLGNEPPVMIRPGQRIGGLTLKRVDQAMATFVSPHGQQTTLSVSKGGSP